MARKPTDLIQLKVRMRERLRAQLEREAERQGHSLNAEIVKRLERSFEPEGLDEKIQHLATYIEAAQQQNREILEELRRERMQRRGYQLRSFLEPELQAALSHGRDVTVNLKDLTPQQRTEFVSLLNEWKTDPETPDLTGEEPHEIIIRATPMEEGGDGNS